MDHAKGKRTSQRFSLSNTMNSLTSESDNRTNRRTSTSERRSRSDERKESRRISNSNFNITQQSKRFIFLKNFSKYQTGVRNSVDPRDTIQDLTEEERLALFRVGRRRRPTEFQLFSGLYAYR